MSDILPTDEEWRRTVAEMARRRAERAEGNLERLKLRRTETIVRLGREIDALKAEVEKWKWVAGHKRNYSDIKWKSDEVSGRSLEEVADLARRYEERDHD